MAHGYKSLQSVHNNTETAEVAGKPLQCGVLAATVVLLLFLHNLGVLRAGFVQNMSIYFAKLVVLSSTRYQNHVPQSSVR